MRASYFAVAMLGTSVSPVFGCGGASSDHGDSRVESSGETAGKPAMAATAGTAGERTDRTSGGVAGETSGGASGATAGETSGGASGATGGASEATGSEIPGGAAGGIASQTSGGTSGGTPGGTSGGTASEAGGGAAGETSATSEYLSGFLHAGFNQLDLLLVIDNSQSMAHKQAILAQAIPQLVSRLVNPPCVDASGDVVEQPTDAQAFCSVGAREFQPQDDVHIGVISSSLGGTGGSFCEDWTYNGDASMADMAHLMGSVRDGLGGGDTGFLDWDNREYSDYERGPTPINDLSALDAQLSAHVVAVGELGCEFEAPLEAWYRFLIDPNPYYVVVVDPSYSVSMRVGTDQIVLDQREQFLHRGSLVAVIMLSDENDCSIQASGPGNLVTTFVGNAGQFRMSRGTTVCEASPNDPCCVSCATEDWPSACAPRDELCPNDGAMTDEEDSPKLRCFDQKRRFGMDLLYPTARYAIGLRSPQFCPDSTYPDADCNCEEATRLGVPCDPGSASWNPLLVTREPSMVFLAGIVGVPWQELATDDTREAPRELRYRSAAEIDWKRILGDPENLIPPASLTMRESVTPRSGLPGPESAVDADAIIGHEWNTSGSDLEYACIFPLPSDMVVDCATVEEELGCDCAPSTRDGATDPLEDVNTMRKPLCQAEDGSMGTTQYYAKAYPGLRELEVLKSHGENSVVASVCPKTLDAAVEDSGYGYNAAVNAIVDRLKEKIGPMCWSNELPVDEEAGLLECEVVEFYRSGPCDCSDERGRFEIGDRPELVRKAYSGLDIEWACDWMPERPSCDSYCLCGIQQYSADSPDHEACLETVHGAPPVSKPGYCYIDAVDPDESRHIGNEELVAHCEPSERRALRFLGDDMPAHGTYTVLVCSD